ncbi:MAG: YbaB/EbfC family nucleoid-associated protein [Anaerolineales bacterium]
MGKQRKPSLPGGGPGMMAQLQHLQEEMERAQRELEEETVTVTSGGGAITIMMTGGQQCRSVRISPEALQQADPDLLGDMLTAAFNQTVEASKELMQRKLGPLMP